MSTPVLEKEQFSFPAFAADPPSSSMHERLSSDEDGTLHGEGVEDGGDNHLRFTPSYTQEHEHLDRDHRMNSRSPTTEQQRKQSRMLDDDLELLHAERVVSNAAKSSDGSNVGRSKTLIRSRSRTGGDPVDDFDVDTTPIHEKNRIYQPPANPSTKFAKFFKKVHNSSFIVRWFVYITPLTLLFLIPVLLGLLKYPKASVGGVELPWFGIWLEIVWLTLWAGRLLAKTIPWFMGLFSSIFTSNNKRWRDFGRALEIPATIFFWWLAIEISFLPATKNHHVDGKEAAKPWEVTTNKVFIGFFVFAILNLFEKIIIQLIAISFHLRTYSDRIEVNKFQIASLVKLYIFSKEKIAMSDEEFEEHPTTGPSSGRRTPGVYINKAQKNARQVLNRVGDVAGKVAEDFTGQAVKASTHPHQVVLQLLNSTTGSQVLARRLYRTFAHEESETVLGNEFRPAFDNDEESDAAFTMFDKDLNGDISMEELESVCVEIGRERKAISASLKDLDSVVSKLDDVFMFIVVVISVLVLISIISTSASGVLTSAGSAVLALSWLFSATAQEFLQSVIFVFVKHPFDVGDRVTIYGNTGAALKGDDYFVKEISLLFTEFKKMEGHVVQAPNSYLNTLFILNQRRSGGLAEAVPVTIKFGTTLEQIDSLRLRLLEFVGSENREYQKNILTELTTIYEAYSITLNVVFFYKSNWQNELLRLQRRNKFICAMMITMNELGIEGPRMKLPGAAEEWPVYLNNAYPTSPPNPNTTEHPGPGPRSGSLASDPNQPARHPSILRTSFSSRNRSESISQMGRRVDFSLGMSSISSGADLGDVYEDRRPKLPPTINFQGPSPDPSASNSKTRLSEDVSGGLQRMDSEGSGLGRVWSGTSSQRVHQNRFFGRKRSQLGNSAEEGLSLEDLEEGRGARVGGVGSDLEGIPEARSRGNSDSWNKEEDDMLEKGGGSRSGSKGRGTIDPRSGIVSPQAVMSDEARERGQLPSIWRGVRRSYTEQVGKK